MESKTNLMLFTAIKGKMLQPLVYLFRFTFKVAFCKTTSETFENAIQSLDLSKFFSNLKCDKNNKTINRYIGAVKKG